MKKKTPKKPKYIRVEICSCKHCGRLTVILGNEHRGLRLSGHKCAGAWNTVSSFDVPVSDFRANVKEACRAYGFEKA
jgi:hypothetical protein